MGATMHPFLFISTIYQYRIQFPYSTQYQIQVKTYIYLCNKE